MSYVVPKATEKRNEKKAGSRKSTNGKINKPGKNITKEKCRKFWAHIQDVFLLYFSSLSHILVCLQIRFHNGFVDISTDRPPVSVSHRLVLQILIHYSITGVPLPLPPNQHKNWRNRKTELRMRAVWEVEGWGETISGLLQNRTALGITVLLGLVFILVFRLFVVSLCELSHCTANTVLLELICCFVNIPLCLNIYIYYYIYKTHIHTYMLDIYRTTFFFFFFFRLISIVDE